jgi:hypothetical protein
MPCPWHEGLAICGSNLVILPAVVLAFRRGRPYFGTYVACVATISLLYHACGCEWWCAGLPFRTYLVMDVACSYCMIPMLCALLLGLRSWKARTVVHQLCFLVCLALVLTDRSRWAFRIALLGAGFAAVIVKFAFVERFGRRGPPRDYLAIVLGLGLVAIGATFFCFDTGLPYWIGHSLWHASVFAGTAALVHGTAPQNQAPVPEARGGERFHLDLQ